MRATNLVLQATSADYQFEAAEYGRLLTGRSVFLNAEYLRERFALAADAQAIGQAILAIYTLLVSDAENIEPMPGLDALLKFLAAEDINLAVASGSRPEHVEKMLGAVNLTSTFPVVSSGGAGMQAKPAPDIYIKALNELHADPQYTIAIEDSYSGVRAAHAAGLAVIAVKNDFTRAHDLSEANYVAADLFEVKDYLKRAG